MIKKCENPKAFIDYLQAIDNINENLKKYQQRSVHSV